MTRIKICGLMRDADIACVNRLRPDYIGFVFAKGRRRYVAPELAAGFKAKLSPDIGAVGVFVDEDIDAILDIARADIIDIIQLHGHESNEYIRELRGHTTKPIIKAFRVQTAGDIRLAEESDADMVLLDNGIGGTGSAFDWSLPIGAGREFILAGGLDPANVREAVRLCHPYAVDVSSGVETDGAKDERKIADFIAAVRG